MAALWILLGISAFVLLIVAILSVKVTLLMSYDSEFKLSVKWLFIKLKILPKKEKEDKPKKEKTKKEKPKKEKDKTEEEKNEEKAEEKPKKDNILVAFYKNQGLSGVIQLLNDTVSAIGGMFGSIFKHMIFHELKLHITVGTDDSAETAILYGKTCSSVFPAMGLITSTCKVKEFGCRVDPNFIEPEKSAKFNVVLSIRPIFITNAVVVLAFKLLFKVVLKLLSNTSAESSADKKAKDNVKIEENNSQGGK